MAVLEVFFSFQETKYKSLENRLTFPSCQLFTKFSVVNLWLIPGSITSSFLLIFIFSVWKNTFNKSWKQFNDNKWNTLCILRSVRIVQMIDLFSFFVTRLFQSSDSKTFIRRTFYMEDIICNIQKNPHYSKSCLD